MLSLSKHDKLLIIYVHPSPPQARGKLGSGFTLRQAQGDIFDFLRVHQILSVEKK